MDTTAARSRLSRFDRRYSIPPRHVRHQQGQEVEAREKEQLESIFSTPRDLEEDQPDVMRRSHHSHHRRAPQAAANLDSGVKIRTVNVEVIATVDSSGKLLGQETRTQESSVPAATAVGAARAAMVSPASNAAASILSPAAISSPAPASLPQVPAVPPFPTAAVPAVPSVPSYPSNFKVPAYPFSSNTSARVLAATTASVLPSSVSRSPAPAISSASSRPASNSASKSASNTTSSSLSSLSGSQVTVSNSASVLVLGFSSSSDSATATASSQIPTTTHADSSTASPTPEGTTFVGGAGGGNTAVPPAQRTSAAAAGTGASGNGTPLPTPQVVGSIVGSLAGAALILAIVLLLLRRHKRKRQGTLQLTDENDQVPVMSQDPARANRIPSTFLNRFSGMSRSTADTSASGGERSFQRVSGRKLPSAFSEGMTSEQFSRGGIMSLSETSFYQDDHGIYGGGPGFAKEFGQEIAGGTAPTAAGAAAMNIRPSPARTPVVRHADEDVNPFADPAPLHRTQSHLSPPQTPNPDVHKPTLGRSLYSQDGSRSSKFTENV